jgi:hypothetical protein
MCVSRFSADLAFAIPKTFAFDVISIILLGNDEHRIMTHGSVQVATSTESQPLRQYVVADARSDEDVTHHECLLPHASESSRNRLFAQARSTLWAACLKPAIETLDLQTRLTSGHVEEPCVIPTEASCSETDSLSADGDIFSPRSDTLAFGVAMALMFGMPEHSRRTVTASDPRKRRWLEDPEPPIALRAWSTSIGNQEHELDLGQTTYVCGPILTARS